MDLFTVIIIEDEVLNTELLRAYLEDNFPELEIIGDANNVSDGVKIINNLKPDVILLDIKLGDEDSSELLDRLDDQNSLLVFITSYDNYALKAYEYKAFDYITKPVFEENFIETIKRVVNQLKIKNHFDSSKKEPSNIKSNLSFIPIPSISKIEFIKIDEIIYCKADGRYTIFYLKNDNKILATKNLGEYEKLLDNKNFFRIHHTYLVNLDMVESIYKSDGYYCLLNNKTQLPIAKKRKEDLNKYLLLK